MPEPNLDYQSMLADLQAQREALIQVVQGLDLAIEGLAKLVPGASTTTAPIPAGAAGKSAGIQSDTFFRMKIGDAAKKYLEMVGQPPRSLMAITSALNKGGLRCTAGSVATIVAREARDQGFVKVGADWGLEAWYEERKENGANP